VKLPNAERARVDIEKLTSYTLNPTHPRGRHKARVFKSALGFDLTDAPFLRALMIRAAKTGDAHHTSTDEFGERYIIDTEYQGISKKVIIRSSWIVKTGETFARFVGCHLR
jgi:hypothetical protein